MASNGSRPVIGLTTYLEQSQCGVWDVRASFLPEVYLTAVNRAGGTAVLMPPQPADLEAARDLVSRLDGLLLPGGKDVDPARYGQTPHETTDEPRRDRDSLEDYLLTAAIEANLPLLGICRGAQILNVHQGGNLVQHLPEVIGHDHYQKGGGTFTTMDVVVDEGTHLSRIVGDRVAGAQMYHHQAIDTVGRDVVVSARTADGVIEGIELTTVDFGIAVQWHPEETIDSDPRLFDALIEAAHHYRSRS
nr:MAG: glutamine amidotransferase [actinobacterium acMicro-1]